MATVERPSTSCQTHRPPLTDDEPQSSPVKRNILSRSHTFDGGQSARQPTAQQQQQQQQVRQTRSRQTSPTSLEYLPQRIGRSLLSNDNWRQETMVDIKTTAKVIEQSDQNILFGKGMDPLPHVRELLNEMSNTEAFLHARQCRVVVAKLRFCWIDINEEIKSLLKHKEYTEATIEHIRKDLIINKETVDRRRKPRREAEADGVDDILAAEKHHLRSIKRILELNCKNIVDQMQKLNEVRLRVAKIGKERAVVTELICQCLTGASRNFELARNEKIQNASGRRAQAPPMPVPPRPTSALGFRPPRVSNNPMTKSTVNFSTNDNKGPVEGSTLDENGLPMVGHLLAFTPDVIQAFQDAAKLIEESREIKKQAMNQIRDAFNDAKAYSLTVNQSIAQKLADIISLAQHLTISLGENSLAQNRAFRWYDLTMSAHRSNAGPLSSSYYKISERPDRPIMRTFQKHPAHQVPDAQILNRTTANLQQSAEETTKQLKALKVVGQRLKANLADKEAALEVDAQILRRRREQSNHKWAVSKYVHV